jgi:single-stranded-DNA-specific exonuclease
MSEWPAPADSLARGRGFLAEHVTRGVVAIAADSDVDGLCAAVLFERALARRGGASSVLVAGRGEHVHTGSMRARIVAAAPAALVVCDMGSRPGAIVPGLPTLLVDHHQPSGFPDGAVVVSAAGHEPVAPTGLLAFELVRSWADVEDLDWLAVLATHGDLGSGSPFTEMNARSRRYRRAHVAEAVALLNAARRAGTFRGEVALAALRAARSPGDIARGAGEDLEALRACRAEVNGEVARCSRVAPRVLGRVALIRFSSPAQVHPLVATRWAGRLKGQIVVAANDGYLPGRVNFAVRAADPSLDLVAFLRALPFRPTAGEYGHGHPRATGGSLTPEDFGRFLRAATA